MKVYVNQFNEHLRKKLHAVYIISGDEPMQLNQCCDAVREQARRSGYLDRSVYSVDIDSNHTEFLQSAGNFCLFADRKIIEIRMPKGKPGKEWAKALNSYMDQAPDDTLLLVSGGKLERGVTASAWYKKAAKLGVTTAVWPLKANELHSWINARFRYHKLQATRSAIGLLAARVEGNLLAAEQEISKLALLISSGKVNDSDVVSSVANSSRYSVFDLADAALENNTPRTTRIIYSLQSEGIAPALVLWSLSQDVQRLCLVVQLCKLGTTLENAISKAPMPPMRRALIKKAVQFHCERSAIEMQSHCAYLDRLLKGREKGDIWQELLQLALMIAGKQLFRTA